MKTGSRNTSMGIIVALGIVYILWGSTYLGIKFAIKSIPPFIMCGIRFLIAGALLYAWARFRGEAKPTRRQWWSATFIGGLLLLGGNGLLSWAEQYVSSGIAALIVATTPIWLVLLDWLWLKNARPNKMIFAGLFFGFIGIVLLAGQGGENEAYAIDTMGVIAILFAAFFWAIGSLYSKKADLPGNALLSVGMQMFAGGLLLTAVGFIGGEWQAFSFSQVTAKSWAALAYLIVFGAMIGFTCYLWLLKNAPAELVATYAYVNPVVAVFLGWALASEPITMQTLIASGVIIFSVVLITFGKRSPSIPTVSEPVISREKATIRKRLARRRSVRTLRHLANRKLVQIRKETA